MLPIHAIRLDLGSLLAADVAVLAPVSANKIALVMGAFVPDENLVLSGLTLATFTGSTPLAGVSGAQEVGVDPVTGQQVITINTPAGGWRWITGDAVNLPQTIYGYALVDNAAAVLLGMDLLVTPVSLTGAGQVVDLGTVNLSIVLQPIS